MRGAALRPLAEFWSSVLPPLLDTLADNRARRLRSSARFQRARLDRRIAGLQAFERELAEEEGEVDTTGTTSTPVEDPYTTEVDGESTVPDTTTTTPSTTTPAEAPATPTTTPTTPAAAAAPSSRVLYEIFDRLKSDDYTEDHYPKVSVVNEQLEAEGEVDVDRETMRPVFDRWFHDRIEEGRLTPPTLVGTSAAPAPLKAVTTSVLYTAFDDLDSNDYTEDGFPLVKQVGERIPDDYEKPDQATIRAAWETYPRKPT